MASPLQSFLSGSAPLFSFGFFFSFAAITVISSPSLSIPSYSFETLPPQPSPPRTRPTFRTHPLLLFPLLFVFCLLLLLLMLGGPPVSTAKIFSSFAEALQSALVFRTLGPPLTFPFSHSVSPASAFALSLRTDPPKQSLAIIHPCFLPPFPHPSAYCFFGSRVSAHLPVRRFFSAALPSCKRIPPLSRTTLIVSTGAVSYQDSWLQTAQGRVPDIASFPDASISRFLPIVPLFPVLPL